MAHNCPECGMICYCGGDIDDCCFDEPQAVNRCGHCPPEDEREMGLGDFDEAACRNNVAAPAPSGVASGGGPQKKEGV